MYCKLKYVVLLMCATCLYAARFRCDYKYYKGIGWLKFNQIPLTFQDARLQCHLEGAELASPTDQTIWKVMQDSITRLGYMLTGIHTAFSKGQFHTIDGIPLSEIPHKWALRQFQTEFTEKNCISMTSEGLFTVECEKPKPFICHRNITDTNVTVCGTIDTEYHYDKRTNKCYKLHTTRRQFQRAIFACNAEGGHLAIINSKTESQVIKDLFAKYPKEKFLGVFDKDVAFIGFHNWGESADWTTIHGQSLEDAGFAVFADGQPDNATTGEYCGSVHRNGLLHDLLCEGHYAFICEKSKEFPRVCDSSI